MGEHSQDLSGKDERLVMIPGDVLHNEGCLPGSTQAKDDAANDGDGFHFFYEVKGGPKHIAAICRCKGVK